MLNPQGQGLIVVILLVVVIGSGYMVGGFNYIVPKASNPPVESPTAGSAQIASSEDAVCSHLDGICHALSEALCCDRTRVLCANEKCSGYLPPLSTYQAGNPTPTISPQCEPLNGLCKSTCGKNEGFLCL